MQDNIDSRDVLNRKIIIELRFRAEPTFLDNKGTLISKISAMEKNLTEWSIGENISLTDHKDPNEVRSTVNVGIDRLALICTSISSINDYFNRFEKLYKLINETFEDLTILRIGCRIQGTYKTKSNDFNEVFKRFSSSLPSAMLVDDFPAKDIKIKLDYQNGTYEVGPVQENDPFVRNNFLYAERQEGTGVGIDTDNYLLINSGINLNDIKKIKDVFIASLSVEKTLLDNLKEF